MTTPVAAKPRGELYALEQLRLSTYGEQTLRNAGALMTELLDIVILPGIVADMLSVVRDDFGVAADAKSGHALPAWTGT